MNGRQQGGGGDTAAAAASGGGFKYRKISEFDNPHRKVSIAAAASSTSQGPVRKMSDAHADSDLEKPLRKHIKVEQQQPVASAGYQRMKGDEEHNNAVVTVKQEEVDKAGGGEGGRGAGLVVPIEVVTTRTTIHSTRSSNSRSSIFKNLGSKKHK